MASANDIITDSLTRIGVYSPGETISDADAERCLSILNDMIDSWSNESLSCFEILEQSGAMIIGQNSYTIGTGGNFAVTRPLRLINGPGAAYIQDINGNNYGVDVVPRDQWNLIANRSSTVTSNVPNTLFYDPQYPLGVINVFPTPNVAWTLFWDSYLQLVTFTALATAMSLPPGYKDALQKCLAVEIWSDFKTPLDPPQWLMALAEKAKGNVKRTNIRPNVAVYDPEIVSHAVQTYNIVSDRGSGSS